ncbi:MAG: heme-binding protein [Chloroflexi bacterium]|nr:heme-binding protein [Chloroflexota bacterium]
MVCQFEYTSENQIPHKEKRGFIRKFLLLIGILGLVGLSSALFAAVITADDDDDDHDKSKSECNSLPSHSELLAALSAALDGKNGGLSNEMWATVVDSNGVVCQLAKTGDDNNDQWLGSRVISAQKANTANAFSLNKDEGPLSLIPGLALSTANLFSAVQPGGSLFGLQESNPVDTKVAYGGDSDDFGTDDDPMIGKKIGGVNVFGGGLALYDADGVLVGAVGVSGDTSCADHNVAWRTRDGLGLDFVPAGLSGVGFDNLIFDIADDAHGNPESVGGFGHPICGFGEEVVAGTLPATHPIGP